MNSVTSLALGRGGLETPARLEGSADGLLMRGAPAGKTADANRHPMIQRRWGHPVLHILQMKKSHKTQCFKKSKTRKSCARSRSERRLRQRRNSQEYIWMRPRVHINLLYSLSRSITFICNHKKSHDTQTRKIKWSPENEDLDSESRDLWTSWKPIKARLTNKRMKTDFVAFDCRALGLWHFG
jgi:hypothetical protein